MKTIQFLLLVAVSVLAVGCACKDKSCCKGTASIKQANSHSYGIMLEGSY